MNVDKVIWYS